MDTERKDRSAKALDEMASWRLLVKPMALLALLSVIILAALGLASWWLVLPFAIASCDLIRPRNRPDYSKEIYERWQKMNTEHDEHMKRIRSEIQETKNRMHS